MMMTNKNLVLRRSEIIRAAAVVTLILAAAFACAQESVTIRVEADKGLGPWKPVWRYFGYDEPNYTYMAHGRELLSELAATSVEPIYIRTHNLLTSGTGQPALKWGSTNAYTEDAAGRPVYDWTIVDRIFDAYRDAGIRPFVEIGFMPQALSIHPEPYQHNWPKGPLDTGWSYPPKDYTKWSQLVEQWVRHCVQRYGRAQVESWYWELWNEPDIFYWHGSADDYFKLYDLSAAAVKRALPTARIGGPATTSPSGKHAGEYLRQFLEHCSSGKNYATGGTGCPLDFISYHAKGRVTLVDGHSRMDIAKQTADVRQGLEIISGFPRFKTLPVILSESDPEGCGACSARQHRENSYRNGPLYAAYTAAMLGNILDLSERYGNRVEGMLTWAFEFEGQPYFEGYRALATNGIDKPILNLFRMAGLMRGVRLQVRSDEPTTAVASRELPEPDVRALATRSDRELSVLVWNYFSEDTPGPDEKVALEIEGLQNTPSRVLLTHYRIDQFHSNAYALWQQIGSPQDPTPQQYAALTAAGGLQTFESPRWIDVEKGKVRVRVTLPRDAVSLFQIRW